jgi:hypothetical protein
MSHAASIQPSFRIVSFSLPLIMLAIINLALILGQSWLLPQRLELPLAGREANYRLTGVHGLEQDGSRPFRWTQDRAIYIVDRPTAGLLIWNVWLGAPAPGLEQTAFQLGVNDRQIATITPQPLPRIYHVLLAPLASEARLALTLQSPTVQVGADPRLVGLRLEGIGLRVIMAQAQRPALPWLAIQLGLLALVLVLGSTLHWPHLVQIGLMLGCAIGLLVLTHFAPSIVFSYTLRLLIVLGSFAGIVWFAMPYIERLGTPQVPFARIAISLTLLALLVRLLGTLYPLYQAHDLTLNVERLIRTLGGTLIATNRSFEFRSGVTIYPPGPYLIYLPFLLAGVAPTLLVQAGNAIIDGLGALSTIALARVVGASEHTALLAGFAYAALPVMLTSIYWGHSAQIFGQALMPLLAIALIVGFRNSYSHGFLFAGITLALAFLTHIGVTILAIAWLGLAWLWMLLARRYGRTQLLRFTIALGAATLVGFGFVYGPALFFKIAETAKVGERVASEQYISWPLIWRAAIISFYPIGLLLCLPGLWQIRRLRLPSGALELGGAWMVACLIFLMVEIATGLQVRYFVFFAPIACLLIALALEPIAQRGTWGRIASWGLVAVLVLQGCVGWFNGTFNDIQMSMVPLLR